MLVTCIPFFVYSQIDGPLDNANSSSTMISNTDASTTTTLPSPSEQTNNVTVVASTTSLSSSSLLSSASSLLPSSCIVASAIIKDNSSSVLASASSTTTTTSAAFCTCSSNIDAKSTAIISTRVDRTHFCTFSAANTVKNDGHHIVCSAFDHPSFSTSLVQSSNISNKKQVLTSSANSINRGSIINCDCIGCTVTSDSGISGSCSSACCRSSNVDTLTLPIVTISARGCTSSSSYSSDKYSLSSSTSDDYGSHANTSGGDYCHMSSSQASSSSGVLSASTSHVRSSSCCPSSRSSDTDIVANGDGGFVDAAIANIVKTKSTSNLSPDDRKSRDVQKKGKLKAMMGHHQLSIEGVNITGRGSSLGRAFATTTSGASTKEKADTGKLTSKMSGIFGGISGGLGSGLSSSLGSVILKSPNSSSSIIESASSSRLGSVSRAAKKRALKADFTEDMRIQSIRRHLGRFSHKLHTKSADGTSKVQSPLQRESCDDLLTKTREIEELSPKLNSVATTISSNTKSVDNYASEEKIELGSMNFLKPPAIDIQIEESLIDAPPLSGSLPELNKSFLFESCYSEKSYKNSCHDIPCAVQHSVVPTSSQSSHKNDDGDSLVSLARTSRAQSALGFASQYDSALNALENAESVTSERTQDVTSESLSCNYTSDAPSRSTHSVDHESTQPTTESATHCHYLGEDKRFNDESHIGLLTSSSSPNTLDLNTVSSSSPATIVSSTELCTGSFLTSDNISLLGCVLTESASPTVAQPLSTPIRYKTVLHTTNTSTVILATSTTQSSTSTSSPQSVTNTLPLYFSNTPIQSSFNSVTVASETTTDCITIATTIYTTSTALPPQIYTCSSSQHSVSNIDQANSPSIALDSPSPPVIVATATTTTASLSYNSSTAPPPTPTPLLHATTGNFVLHVPAFLVALLLLLIDTPLVVMN